MAEVDRDPRESAAEPLSSLDYVVLDLNGTLTDRGRLIDGVEERLQRLSRRYAVEILTADTFGTAEELGRHFDLPVRPINSGEDKAQRVRELGAEVTVAIGNGRNDAAMLRAAALGIAALGPEGTATDALLAADVIYGSIDDALDFLLRKPPTQGAGALDRRATSGIGPS